ncbi:hypothetical protein GQ53DRAFT_818998 [Thozetella sp. PMI_491]|nr:hypothetical protein GQ53DRAFT_818998 [Thozetella sp. PMI_491]
MAQSLQLRLPYLMVSILAATECIWGLANSPFPPTMIEFSSQFQQPLPPVVKTEFNASFIQHKWNQHLSHITAGYLYHSPTRKEIRVDQAYSGTLGSSMFNFNNVTEGGLVDNTLISFTDTCCTSPQIWRGYVNSDFPLIMPDVLINAEAVFVGLARRDLTKGEVAAWSILYQGLIPATVFVDPTGVIVGYDYFFPVDRTRVVTEFFNIVT